jgi:hypothetical protein
VLQEAVVRSPSVITDNGNMIKKIAFPAELLPVCLVGYGIVNLLVGLGVFMATALLVLDGNPFTAMTLALPLVIAVQAILMLGIADLLSSISVFIRDIAASRADPLHGVVLLHADLLLQTPEARVPMGVRLESGSIARESPTVRCSSAVGCRPATRRPPFGGPSRSSPPSRSSFCGFGYTVFMAKKQDFADEL